LILLLLDLHHADVDNIANVSEVHAASIHGAEMNRKTEAAHASEMSAILSRWFKYPTE
jgi:hypothetical protein